MAHCPQQHVEVEFLEPPVQALERLLVLRGPGVEPDGLDPVLPPELVTQPLHQGALFPVPHAASIPSVNGVDCRDASTSLARSAAIASKPSGSPSPTYGWSFCSVKTGTRFSQLPRRARPPQRLAQLVEVVEPRHEQGHDPFVVDLGIAVDEEVPEARDLLSRRGKRLVKQAGFA